MAIPELKVLLLVICSVLLLLNEATWQWRWWRLDNSGVGVTSCSGNQILIRNDSKATVCQPCPICSEDTILSPPCGSILTQDTVIECKPSLTKALMGSKWKKSEREKSSSLNKRKKSAPHGNSKDDGSIGSQNVNRTVWPSLDVSDISDEEELEDSNLLETTDFQSFLSPTQDAQGLTTLTPPTQTFLSKAFHRWRQRRVNPKFPAALRPNGRPPAEAKTLSEQPISEQINKESCSFTASISCVLGGFLGTSLACLLSGSALVWLLWSLQKRRGWYRWNRTELPESEVEGKNYFTEK